MTLAPGERAAPAESALGSPAQAGKAERRHMTRMMLRMGLR